MANTKYIFITGGVVSSLGKGIAAASLGALLESRGLSNMEKFLSLMMELKQTLILVIMKDLLDLKLQKKIISLLVKFMKL